MALCRKKVPHPSLRDAKMDTSRKGGGKRALCPDLGPILLLWSRSQLLCPPGQWLCLCLSERLPEHALELPQLL